MILMMARPPLREHSAVGTWLRRTLSRPFRCLRMRYAAWCLREQFRDDLRALEHFVERWKR